MGKPAELSVSMAKRIELWPIDRLQPYANNARTHSSEQLNQIKASILEFGFVNPILVDSDEGVIAGHGRLEAAKDMGLTEVPVVVLDHLSPAQRKAYVIADNQIALNAGWDRELLQLEMAALSLADFDMDVLGFSEDELASLLGDEDMDLEDGVNATAGADELEEADTQVCVGMYRFKLERHLYLQWRDAIREQVGYEDADVEAEIRRRLQIPA